MKEVTAIVIQAEAPRPFSEMAQAINHQLQECEAAARASLAHALEAGRLLNVVKRQTKHGEWLPWLKANISVSQKTAWQYMQLDQRRDELANYTHGYNLSVREALRLLDEVDTEMAQPPGDNPPPSPSSISSPSANGHPAAPTSSENESEHDDPAPPTQEESEAVLQSFQGARPAAPAAEDEDDDAPGRLEGEEEVPTDDEGVDLPPQARPAFEQRTDLRKLCRDLDDMARRVEELGRSPAGLHTHWQSAQAGLKSVKSTLWAGRPAHVCPYCQGGKSDCRVCRGHGWVTVTTFKADR